MVDLELKSKSQKNQWFLMDENGERIPHFRGKAISRAHLWRPPTDVYETEDSIIVRVEVAGMREAQFSVSLDDRKLTVYGIRPDQSERRAYHQMEIRFGEFKTEVELHWPVDAQSVEAEYKDGFLRLVLPKSKPQKIDIGN